MSKNVPPHRGLLLNNDPCYNEAILPLSSRLRSTHNGRISLRLRVPLEKRAGIRLCYGHQSKCSPKTQITLRSALIISVTISCSSGCAKFSGYSMTKDEKWDWRLEPERGCRLYLHPLRLITRLSSIPPSQHFVSTLICV